MSARQRQNGNKPKSAKEARVSCRVTSELLNRLEKIAAHNGIDVSDVVRMSLKRIIPEFEAGAPIPVLVKA